MPSLPPQHAGAARLGVADLQVHTSFSDGMATPEEVVRWADAQTDLDLIAVTDHDAIDGALEARAAAQRLATRVQVIVGLEVSTRSGHLLALFVEQPVPSFRSLDRTVEAIHAQGGLCIVPHPLGFLTTSIGRRSLDRLSGRRGAAHSVDGIELANPTPAARLRARGARRLNRTCWHLAETGGSDAHFPEAIASAVTRFPGRGSDDLRRALAARLTVAESRSAPSLRQIGLRRLARQQLRGLSATPRAILLPRRGER